MLRKSNYTNKNNIYSKVNNIQYIHVICYINNIYDKIRKSVRTNIVNESKYFI